MGLFDLLQRKVQPIVDVKKEEERDANVAAIVSELEAKASERKDAQEMEDITPEEYNGLPRAYHYKDVSIAVTWKYGGRYGKSLSDLGMEHGVPLELAHDNSDTDPDSIAVLYRGTQIGEMLANRLRNMVGQWKEADLPVLAYANSVGGSTVFLMELAFYGRPSRRRQTNK